MLSVGWMDAELHHDQTAPISHSPCAVREHCPLQGVNIVPTTLCGSMTLNGKIFLVTAATTRSLSWNLRDCGWRSSATFHPRYRLPPFRLDQIEKRADHPYSIPRPNR